MNQRNCGIHKRTSIKKPRLRRRNTSQNSSTIESVPGSANRQLVNENSEEYSQLRSAGGHSSWHTSEPSAGSLLRPKGGMPSGMAENFILEFSRPWSHQQRSEEPDDEEKVDEGGIEEVESQFPYERLLHRPTQRMSAPQVSGKEERESPFPYQGLLQKLARNSMVTESREEERGDGQGERQVEPPTTATDWFWQCHICLRPNPLPTHLRDWAQTLMSPLATSAASSSLSTCRCSHTRCGWCFDVDENGHCVRFCSGLHVTARQYENFLRYGRSGEAGAGLVDPDGVGVVDEVAGRVREWVRVRGKGRARGRGRGTSDRGRGGEGVDVKVL